MVIEILVNGDRLNLEADAGARLIDLLRARGLTGTKDACSRGECGACTVLIGDRPTLACLVLAARVRAPVRTIEGVGRETAVLRERFADHGALQCGYCTPGQVLQAHWLLTQSAERGPVRAADLDGNICRCTGSQPILAAIADLQGRTSDDR